VRSTLLLWNAVVPLGRIQVKVQIGWVSLIAKVKWRYQLVAAENQVCRLSGIASVTNEIVIKLQYSRPTFNTKSRMLSSAVPRLMRTAFAFRCRTAAR
jgi:osmotically-inducible protein OsmY